MGDNTQQFLSTCRRLLLWSPSCINIRKPRLPVATDNEAGKGEDGGPQGSNAPTLISVGQKLEGVLEIDISDWCDIIDERFLVEVSRDCKAICLTMTQVDAAALNNDLLSWIIKYISPKLLELTVKDCPTLTWVNYVKRILEAAGGIEVLNLQKNPWVDDFVVDQISTKFAKSLKSVDLENTKITDNGLYHIGKRCPNMRTLTLNCCPKISDTGLQQLAKKTHLSNIYLCHNINITDDGVERLIAASNQLYSVRLTNCPRLTDQSMEALYEAIVAWGKRRNIKSLTMRTLELRDNPLMTFQALVFLSTAVPNLVTLDLRDCPGIDLTKGMQEMERMRFIEEIYLGPSNHPLNADAFLQSMLFHAANLKVLHIVGIGSMEDDDLAELISASLLLTDLCIEGMEAGTHTVEAICSHIPNITKFSLIGSKCIADPDIRCLASICHFLTELTLKACPRIGDAAFSRCMSLKRLKRLDLAHCSTSISGQLLGFLTTCPLELLALEGCSFKLSACLKLLTMTTIGSLRELQFKKFKKIESDDVLFMLTTFVKCACLDLTGSVRDSLALELPRLRHMHPFMTYFNDGDFIGFKESVAARSKHMRFNYTQTLTRKFYAARKIQRVRRGFVKWRNGILEQQRLAREAHRMKCITKIQSVFRMCIVRKRVLISLFAGRLIVRGARRFLNNRFYRKYIAAKNHYNMRLRRNLIDLLKRHEVQSKVDLRARAGKVIPRLRFRSRAKTYRYFRDQEDHQREEKLYRKSLVLWEGHLMSLVLRRWKLLRGEARARRAKLAKIFSVVAELETQNSMRQLTNLAMAKHFNRTKNLVLVWICFADDFIRSRKADLLIPKATNHWNFNFFDRVVRWCFKAIIYYIETKRIKAKAIAKAQAGRRHWLIFNGLRYTYEECERMKRIKRNRELCLWGYYNYYGKMALLSRLPINVLFERLNREVASMVIVHWANYKVDFYFHNMMYNCTRFKHWREMTFLAEKLRDRIYGKEYFAKWVNFKLYSQSLGDTLYKQYCLKIAAKCIRSLKQTAKEGIEYRNMVANQMAEAAKRHALEEEDAAATAKRVMAILVEGAMKLQAVCRGILGRKRAAAIRVKVMFATQVLQNFGRRGLALLKYKVKCRRRQLFLHKLEDSERYLMADSDIESKYYELCYKNALLIQRVYRGYIGRIKGAVIAYAISRERGQAYYESNKNIRRNLEKEREALALKERKRSGAATLIQKRVRGMHARARFIRVKLQAKLTACTIRVQTDYRRRLGMLKLNAMRRTKWRDLRYRAARAQRGMLLRMIGLKKRKDQKAFAPVLVALGLDPISFNYRINELIEETKNDFIEMFKVLAREVKLVRQFGFNKKDRDTEKKRILAEDGVGLEVMDSCCIIIEGHPFVGETGVISRVDTSLPGIPLYEIALDSIKRQTFANMTSDPLLTYLYPQPLNEIKIKPKLEGFVQNFILYGVNEGDPIFTRRNITAAWIIQRAFRMYRARRTVARRRFELWLQSCDRQWSFFNQLADANSLTMQANYFLNYLGVRPVKPVYYDEVRHPFLSGRYESSVKKKDEKKAILQEYESKYRQRLLFLQKSALFAGKEVFTVGFERLTWQKKIAMFFQNTCGFSSKGNVKLKDLSGASGAKFVSQGSSMVTGLAQYDFTQFKNSPHVRYYKTYLYQGNWSGIPMFTPLRPHGEGLLVFFDGWGFAREDKVLYLEICCCRYLNAADLDTSDPYCDISCNAANLQTSVKWMNLNPVFHEKFEIDVTNPTATLNIKVLDKDYIGEDDFLGQITIPLAKYADGLEHKETFLLKGEDETVDEDFDRGEIEIKLRWTSRKFEDDLAKDVLQRQKAIRLQAWARRIASIGTRKRVFEERKVLLDMVRERSVQITNTCRIRIARKKLNRLRRRQNAAIKIQKRARIRAARLIYWYRLKRWRASIKIQTLMRRCLAKSTVRRMKKESKAALSVKAAVIQKFIRRKLAYMLVSRMKEEERLLAPVEEDDGDVEKVEVVKPPVSSWINTYGIDPEYGLKRNRRMVQVYFERILRMQYVRVVSKYGIVYIDQYPPEKSQEDAAMERAGGQGLTVRDDFVGVFFPPFNPRITHKVDAIPLLDKFPHTALIHISTSIHFRQSVDFNVISIQCAARQRMARKKKALMMKLHAAFAKLQRAFRRRNIRLQIAATRIQALFHLIHAKVFSTKVRTERNGARVIQSSYRCYRARGALFDLRCVTEVSVLKFSSAVPFHPALKTLDFKMRSFWMTETPDRAEIRYELKRKECIDHIWIMTSTHSSQPKFVEIYTVLNKEAKKYKILLEKTGMQFLKGSRWHIFPIPETIAKYFKFIFYDNYGDESHISVRQIRFVRRKEMSATILKQPDHYISTTGPTVGRRERIVLRVEADGWPIPTYQWYRNGTLIPGETKSELQLSIKCRLNKERRLFRCLKCKMLSRNVPGNAYHIICGNCSTLFNFKEIHEYDRVVNGVVSEGKESSEAQSKLQESVQTMASQNSDKARALLKDLLVQLAECDAEVQNCREALYSTKQDLQYTNRFTDEGVYCCHVMNVRGGSVPILRKTIRTVVVVQFSIPYRVAVKPNYVPRQQSIRKRWTVYHSLIGTFKKGRVEGLVRLRYADGAFYEGPYISEEWLDHRGFVNLEGRPENHYGVYRCSDGRTFEGINVNNHFDPYNLQTFYRLTLPNGEQYEGMFTDEMFHGVGMFKYKDGSVYEGQWFRGTQFGHGHLRSSEGWAYEGYFDTNRRHGDGIIAYADGSMYLGKWYYGKRQGRAVYISPLRDVYRGDIEDGLFHGNGEMLYSDGSRHTGEFKDGKRSGIGIFRDADGSQYFGTFINDLRHGEHIIKAMIPIEEEGQSNLEIRVAIYDMGTFVKWKIKYSNPVATKQFIELFSKDRSMFDSIYSMILARNLPNIPAGVDGANEEVQKILTRVRMEAGGLVGQEAIIAAQKKVEALLKPLRETRERIVALQSEIDATALLKIEYAKDAHVLMRRCNQLSSVIEKEMGRIEQFWMDEPSESRPKFEIACKALSEVPASDFFSFRNHRVPPPFTKKILDAVSYLLGESTEWKRQQLLLADSVTAAREGDDLGLRFDFDCKLAFMMKDYKVVHYAKITANLQELDRIMADPRLRADSYYVESCGAAGPPIVTWIKRNYLYVAKARTILTSLAEVEDKKAQSFRFKAQSVKKTEDAAIKQGNIDVLKQIVAKLEVEVLDLNEALAATMDMLKFLGAHTLFGAQQEQLDYYAELERKIEERRDHFVVETCVQFLVDGVDSRLDWELKAKIRDALAKGEVYEEPSVERPQIRDWLLDEVRAQQKRLIDGGQTLGYCLEGDVEPHAISWDATQEIINRIVWITIAKLNERLNDLADSLKWSTNKGKTFDTRFLYVLAWKMWEEEGEEAKELRAVTAWEEIFGTPEECAKMAIEAKVNTRMTEKAREQGKVWAKRHRIDVEKAEVLLADQFAHDFPDETGRLAMELSEDTSPEIPPSTRAACVSWIRLNPREINDARDERNMEMGEQFGKQYGDVAGELAFRIFNGLATEEEMVWYEIANHWRHFHEHDYQVASDKVSAAMAAAHAEMFSVGTASEAARIIEGDAIGYNIRDPEVQKEFVVDPQYHYNAKCWGMRNQGLLKGATQALRTKHAATANKLWIELETQTEKFRKGSYLLTPADIRDSPGKDRFHGFRLRLEAKFAWLFGYLTKMHFEYYKEMEEMDLKDPFGKVVHNIRPSELDKHVRDTDQAFLRHKRQVETGLGEIFNKLSTWNSYFGRRDYVEKAHVAAELSENAAEPSS